MSAPHRLFVETAYHAAFRYGGWGLVREQGGRIEGRVGGERNTTAGRIDLSALIDALMGLPPGQEVAIHTASPGVAQAVRLLVSPPAPADAPTEDESLWTILRGLTAGRALTLKAGPSAPVRFLRAWAETGQDKAKAQGQGRFSAAIPKPNLAKLVLPA